MAASLAASGGQAKVRPKIAVKDSALRIKIISMGDGGTGKTAIIKRYCEEKVSNVVTVFVFENLCLLSSIRVFE